MKVCDRCKKELDTNKETIIVGKSFELCVACGDYISNHIENYKPKKKGLFGGLSG